MLALITEAIRRGSAPTVVSWTGVSRWKSCADYQRKRLIVDTQPTR